MFIASVEISDVKKLKISLIPSGKGCDFRIGLIKFTVSKEFSYHENKTEIIDDFIWVSKLLRNKKEFRTVEKILNEKKDALIGSYQDDKFISLFPEIDEDGIEKDNEYLQTFMAYFEKELNTSKYTILYFFK
ncbi:hypothetical protein [Gelatiniphilus marinus]|uniref:Uncharacterized protein n=1 Tax=Gelatiniphilus marinus TaxID=1759464 RepID=A0ABW5JLA7_9FLAO